MGWLSKIGDAVSAPFKVARDITGGLLGGGGGGDSSSSSNLKNTTNITIETKEIADAMRSNDSAILALSKQNTAIAEQTAEATSEINKTLRVFADNIVSTSNENKEIMQTIAVLSGVTVAYLMTNKRGKRAR